MNTTLWILIIAVIVYLCRLSGFLVRFKTTSPLLQTYLNFVPIAVFAAVIVPSTLRELDLIGIKLVALFIATLMMRKTGNVGLSMLVGMGTLWIVLIINSL